MRKLSELMRYANALNPTSKGEFFVYDDAGKVVDMCALGACAAVANNGDFPLAGSDYRMFMWQQISRATGIEIIWEQLTDDQIPIVIKSDDRDLDNVIILLFDNHNWNCNQIADWLESIGK